MTEVIAAANSQPFSHIHQPGVGVGGHCIPVYPRFLLEGARPLACPKRPATSTTAWPRYAVDKLAEALGGLEGKTVLILGLSYRPDVKEAAFSSAFLLATAAHGCGRARPRPRPAVRGRRDRALWGWRRRRAFPPAHVDALIVQALHKEYGDLDLAAFAGCRVVLDGRNALSREAVESLGMRYLGIGR